MFLPRSECGRPIKTTGAPCPSHKDRFVPVACFRHMTREERAERKRLSDSREAARQRRWETREPSCWGWEVPTDDELREFFIRSFAGELEQVRKRLYADNLGDRDGLAWWAFEDWHNERCALCGKQSTPLVLDHDHATGLIRGYLCRTCNTTEGMHSGDIEGPYAKYRAKNPATMMGVVMPYRGGWGQEVRDPAPRADRWKNNPLNGTGI